VLLRSYHGASSSANAAAGELPGEHRLGAVDALRATTAAPWYMEELSLDKELGLGKLRASTRDEDDDDDSVSASGDSSAREDPRFKARGGAGAGGGDAGDGDASDGDASVSSSDPEDDSTRRETRADSFPRLAVDAKTCARDASRVESSLRFIDGAIACNNPTSVGIFEARRLFDRNRPLCVVSLGTGAAVPRETKTRSQDIGNVMGNLVNATCDVLQVDTLARHVLHPLSDSYFRFQPVDDVFGCDLNDSREETRGALREAAARYMDAEEVKVELEELARALREE
jgi:hypothetical protein